MSRSYTEKDLERYMAAYGTARAQSKSLSRIMRDCAIKIVAIRKSLGVTDSKTPVKTSSRFLDSLAKLNKEN